MLSEPKPVLLIRAPVLFYPLEPESGPRMNFIRIPELTRLLARFFSILLIIFDLYETGQLLRLGPDEKARKCFIPPLLHRIQDIRNDKNFGSGYRINHKTSRISNTAIRI
jgi:hypothetical protein